MPGSDAMLLAPDVCMGGGGGAVGGGQGLPPCSHMPRHTPAKQILLHLDDIIAGEKGATRNTLDLMFAMWFRYTRIRLFYITPYIMKENDNNNGESCYI